MTDQQQPPQSGAQTTQTDPDPLTSLEAILKQAKNKRQTSISPVDNKTVTLNQEPPAKFLDSPEELETARQKEQAALDEKAEVERQQLLAAHREKMSAALQGTPQFQARQEQHIAQEKKAAEQRATEQGHVIHQLSDTKV